jgi:hypothetical protein
MADENASPAKMQATHASLAIGHWHPEGGGVPLVVEKRASVGS